MYKARLLGITTGLTAFDQFLIAEALLERPSILDRKRRTNQRRPDRGAALVGIANALINVLFF